MHHYQQANSPQRHSYLWVLQSLFGQRRRYPATPAAASAQRTALARPDAELAHAVQQALQAEPTVRAGALAVHVSQGAVTLTGPIDGVGEQWLIDAALRPIAGIQRLTMNFNVVAPEAGMRSDEDIVQACEDVLTAVMPGADYAVRVMVANGRVTLSGSVAWGYERWIAETKVSDLPGVRGVNSQLTVRPRVIGNDVDAIIEAAMRGRPDERGHTVASAIDRDRVTLTGTVHSAAGRRAALNAAQSLHGVKRVIDRLRLV